MKTTNALRTLAVVAMSALTLVSCDKSKPQMDDKAPETSTKPASSKIAFVEVDSIMTQYQFCKEYSKILEQKGNNIQKTLAGKQQQLQAGRKCSRTPTLVSRRRLSRPVCRSRAMTCSSSTSV